MERKRRLSSLSKMDKQILATIGDRIRQLREKKKLSVYDVTGEDMPIKSRQHWQSIENGSKNINLVTIFKIAHILSVKTEDLVKGIG